MAKYSKPTKRITKKNSKGEIVYTPYGLSWVKKEEAKLRKKR